MSNDEDAEPTPVIKFDGFSDDDDDSPPAAGAALVSDEPEPVHERVEKPAMALV